MEIHKLVDMKLGWFIGNFDPAVWKSEDVEICVKNFKKGDVEPTHYQKIATEITVIVSGKARLGAIFLDEGDIATIPPLESADFESLTDVKLVAIKFPSIPDDKVLGSI